MGLITNFLNHPFLYGLLAAIGIAVFLFVVGLVMIPFHWGSKKLSDSRCPKCLGLFKRRLVDWEVVGEKEVLRTVNRVDQGTIYSNSLEPNQTIEINRREQVTFVEQTILNHWVCKDPLCGNKWTTEEIVEHEGSLT
jgi:hypothetical protein